MKSMIFEARMIENEIKSKILREQNRYKELNKGLLKLKETCHFQECFYFFSTPAGCLTEETLLINPGLHREKSMKSEIRFPLNRS